MSLIWKATNDRVIAQIVPPPTETESGIQIIRTNKVPVAQGIVLAVGSAVTGVKVLDRILYESKYALPVAENVISIEGVSVLGALHDDKE